MADTPEIIKVKSAKTDGAVVLWERNDAHPETTIGRKQTLGNRPREAFVVNDGKEYEVAETALVKQLLALGVLLRVNWNSKPPKSDPKPDNKPTVPVTPPAP